MGFRPKEGQFINFVQSGAKHERKGKIKRILKPEFNKHLTKVQYQIECLDSEDVFIEADEITNVYR
ncbi:hypothetical protein [Paenibacillus oleatilyticus]|uniref:hypothetical protein n=1 Tax=Paenibacillus oleatilyticus TaxID=2594886 RepID=UPI001C1F85D0|nr:hypothetical protein [Paenibacillus oleatilyticus]MBU7316041.1 hypothetical protein [Paenibacillus oleatilyticus]